MSTLTEQKTVGEIAAEYPATVRVFQKHSIDFCCGGKRPLRDACEGHGIPAEALLLELEQSLAAPECDATDWNARPLADLINHIVARHHEYLKGELPRLGGMMNKVLGAHGANHGDTLEPLGEILGALSEELRSHLAKEEMVLFPLIEQMETAAAKGLPMGRSHCGSVNNPIRVMEFEHDSAGTALLRMRHLTGGYQVPAGACNTWRGLYHGLEQMEADLHQHIHLENNILFPRAARLEASVL